MRRLKIIEHISLDGVIQRSADEGDFPYEHGLADELLAIVYPVLLGAGEHMFADGTPAQSFAFVKAQTTPSGVILTTYNVGPL